MSKIKSQTFMPALLVIMAKSPLPGRCKTRMKKRLGLRGAALLQANLIRLRMLQAKCCRCRVEMHGSPDLRHPLFLAARRQGVALRKQQAGHLGQRMRRAQDQRPVVIVGTDSTDLDISMIQHALRAVENGNDVLIPALDGGYVLIGFAHAKNMVFQTIDWGSQHVYKQTLRQFRRAGSNPVSFPAIHDLDHPADFTRARQRKQLPAFGIFRY